MDGMRDDICWQAPEARLAQSHIVAFMRYLEESYHVTFTDYDALHAWSIENLDTFWQAVWNFCGCRSDSEIQRVLSFNSKTEKKTNVEINTEQVRFGAIWFSGASLNFAEHLLRHRDNHPALIARNEIGHTKIISYAELAIAVAQCQAGLKRAGVKPGDVIVGLLPNIPETVIIMLAVTSIGAIWSALSPDFGEQAVLDRFSQIDPVLCFTTNAVQYAGKIIDTLSKAKKVCDMLPNCRCVVIDTHGDVSHEVEDLSHYNDFIDPSATECEFSSFPFDHPVYIVYSSGTTGAPKCITHGAGGTLLQHLKELILHSDVHRDDTVFYYTTCAWMMWHWLVSNLALGATVVLYDGSPLHPKPDILLDLIDEFGISIFGASAKYYASLEKQKLNPAQSHVLTTLKTLLSTGSPLLPAQYDYIYQNIKQDVCLSSISGGTDLLSCFTLGTVLKPVRRGECQCLGLGMDVAIYDNDGHPVVGEKGELVCRQPFPSMPVCFWQDDNNQRYFKSYFARFPGVWTHGDYAMMTPHQGLVMVGRSDATLNPGGVRIGTAEIYAVVEQYNEIIESLCVGHVVNGDEQIILFVVMQKGVSLDDQLSDKLKNEIKKTVSAHHVPHIIHAVSGLPRTISGKLVELTVKHILAGEEVDNISALANPEVLAEFHAFRYNAEHGKKS